MKKIVLLGLVTQEQRKVFHKKASPAEFYHSDPAEKQVLGGSRAACGHAVLAAPGEQCQALIMPRPQKGIKT